MPEQAYRFIYPAEHVHEEDRDEAIEVEVYSADSPLHPSRAVAVIRRCNNPECGHETRDRSYFHPRSPDFVKCPECPGKMAVFRFVFPGYLVPIRGPYRNRREGYPED